MSFANTYHHGVDKKGRIFIPAKLRDGLNSDFYVSIPLDGKPCLAIYTREVWDEVQAIINALPVVQRLEVGRIVNSNAQKLECDAQGRINVANNLRDFAGIVENVVIIGNGSTIEIWDEDKWTKNYGGLGSGDISSIMAGINF